MVTIYKKDTSGKIRYLKIDTEESELIQESGVLDTDKPITHRKTCKPKNIGKSNETTGIEQAIKEMNSLTAEKLQEGYFLTKEEAENEEVIFPMLAKVFKDEAKKIDWSGDVYVQPKFDGMRCLVSVKDGDVSFKSRDGRTITTVNHLVLSFKDKPNGVYDGELYCHLVGFQRNMELIKKYRSGETEKVKFYCYDFIDTKTPFKDRRLLTELVFGSNTPNIVLVETIKIKSKDEINSLHTKFLSEGYEGTMLRHSKEGYKLNGRSSSLLKYKDFLDLACEIIDIEPAEQRSDWGVPVLKLPNGKTFRAGMKYSHEERIDFLKNKKDYIGKIGEIRFFEYSNDGVPRFPVMHGIRLDKTKTDKK